MAALRERAFRTMLRMVQKTHSDALLGLRHETWRKMKALGVPRDMSKAASGIPEGSDQIDMQSLVQWIRRVDKSDPASMEQLAILDATLVARTSR